MDFSANPLEVGRMAYARRAWDAAYAALASADAASPLDPADLWRLAQAAYLTGRGDAFVDALERAHRLHLEADQSGPAARCAFWIGFHLANRGDVGPGTGWLARAARILEREGGDVVERGYLLLAEGRQQLATGRMEASYATAADAVAIAQRFGDPDLLALAVHLEGHALLGQARVEAGLARMDEAMVAVTADELSPQVTGLIYCSVIGACRRVYALRRANEWTTALTEWCERQPDLTAYAGECLVYRSEILQLRGAWEEAIADARRAGERLARSPEPRSAALALYQQAEVHRLLGEFAAAEEMYREVSRLGREPQPGLALLRLAQGDVAAASAAIRRALGETKDRLSRARLLTAAVEILLAAQDAEGAGDACDELEQTAAAYDAGVLATQAAHARGAVLLAAGDAMAALVPLRRACREWQALGAPYEVARVRTLLGRACRALGDDDAATLELDAARAELARLGAAPDVARLDALRHGPSAPAARRRSHGLTRRELEVLGLVATGRTNRAIAGELCISEKTVARHVANIFAKLGLSSRSAATAYAYEHDLIQPSA